MTGISKLFSASFKPSRAFNSRDTVPIIGLEIIQVLVIVNTNIEIVTGYAKYIDVVGCMFAISNSLPAAMPSLAKKL